ncbi:MAG: zinc-ribbon domain-containing protein [Lachnospiraceae bacterium]|nr:zinc-ribbon domain-containing protein [Lachnospiraceae bacterium]
MKKIKALCAAAAALLGALLLTGCGGNLNTDLTISEDLSGVRHMVFTADTEENKDHMTGDVTSITATVASNIPEGIDFTSSVDGTVVTYTFDITFSDLEEYEQKVKGILDAQGKTYSEPLIEWLKPASVFATGISYRENFTTSDLMDWFPTLLVNAGYVKEGDKGNVFYKVAQTYSVLGKEGNSTWVSVDTLTFQPLSGIAFYQTCNPDGTFDRIVQVMVPQSTMDAVGDDVRAFLDERSTSVSTNSWNTADGVNTYTLEGKNLTADQVSSMMAAFYGRAGETVYSAATPETSESTSLFTVDHSVQEEIDLTDFVSNAYGDVDLTYYVKDNAEYAGAVLKTASGESALYPYSRDDSGFETLFYTYTANCTVDYTAVISYALDTVNVTLALKNGGNVQRDLELYFAGKSTAEEMEQFRVKTEKALEGSAAELKDCVLEKDGRIRVLVEYSGPASRCAAAFEPVLGPYSQLEVTTNAHAPLYFKKITSVYDAFYLDHVTEQPIGTVNYVLRGIGNVEPYGFDASAMDGRDYKVSYTDYDPGKLISITLVGEKVNYLAYAVAGLIGLLVLWAVVMVLITVIGGAAAKRRAQKEQMTAAAQEITPAAEESAPSTEGEGEPAEHPESDLPTTAVAEPAEEAPTGPAVEAPVEATPAKEDAPALEEADTPAASTVVAGVRYCLQCGASVPEGANFCVKCGFKME